MPRKKNYPKWFSPNNPPIEPTKPVEPQTTLVHKNEQWLDLSSAKCIGDLIALLESHPHEREIVRGGEYNEEFYTVTYDEVPNPTYEYGMKLYAKGLDIYNKELEFHKKQMAAWQELKNKWDEETYQERLAKLNKELAELEKLKPNAKLTG